MQTFTETQRIRHWLYWVPLGIGAAIVLIGLRVKGFERVDFVVLVIPGLLALVFSITRLDTQINETGIHYRFFPFMSWRTIQWTAIRDTDVRSYQFTSYGIRYDFEAWYYIIAGPWGLRITQTNGKQIVIGTQQPELLRQHIPTILSTI